MKNASQTAAGQNEPHYTDRQIDTINQVFSLLSISYNNQFYSAFKNRQTEQEAKKLWLYSLKDIAPDTLLLATKEAIKTSQYMPTISKVLECCEHLHGLKAAYGAYVEACQAPHPKRNFSWSHPVVFYAGRETGWRYLEENPENIAFPIFKNHYEALCLSVRSGDLLPTIAPEALPEHSETTLSKEENRQRMAVLRETLGI